MCRHLARRLLSHEKQGSNHSLSRGGFGAELSFWFFWLSSTLVICPPLFSATQSSSGQLQYFTSVNWEPAEVWVVHGCH